MLILFFVVVFGGGLLVALVVGGGSVAVVTATSYQDSQKPPKTPKAPKVEPPPKTLPISEISSMPDNRSVLLDPSGATSSFTDFDPIADMKWLHRIAKNWSADAQLLSLYISGVHPDGSLDVSSRKDWNVTAYFTSPALRKSALAMAGVSEDEVLSEFQIRISEGEVWVSKSASQSHHLKEPLGEPIVPDCAMSTAMDIWSDHELPQRPFYLVVMQYSKPSRANPDGYWRYDISAKPGFSVTIPKLSPVGCFALDYEGQRKK